MNDTNLCKVAEDCGMPNPIPMSAINETVELQPTKVFESLGKLIYQDMVRIYGMLGSQDAAVTEEEIVKYLKTLVYLRVDIANGSSSKNLTSYKTLRKHVSIPVLVYQLLVQIGPAVDRDYMIRFIPSYSIDGKDLLSLEDLQRVSDEMMGLENHGLKLVFGIPKEEEGDLDFMAMSHVEDVVKSYKKSHPVVGFYASFFAQQELSQLTGAFCRIHYGYESDYEVYLRAFYRAALK